MNSAALSLLRSLFDPATYLARNQDVAAAGVDPLDHFLNFGLREGRSISALFDAEFYLERNPDVRAAGVNPLEHYLVYGHVEGRSANGLFDASFYLQRNADVAAAGVDPFEHYLRFGWREGRDPSAGFDTSAYLAANTDVAAAGVNPLEHYVQYGMAEGRSPLGAVATPSPIPAPVPSAEPVLLATINLAATSDSGRLNDGFTVDATPTLHGAAGDGATVQVLDYGRIVGNAAVVNGQWSFTPGSALSSGDHSLSVRVFDGAGRHLDSSPLELEIGTRSVMTMSALPMGRVAEMTGLARGHNAAAGVAGIGDVNGDGTADILVGSPRGVSGFGEAYVRFGRDDLSTATMASTDPSAGFLIQGGRSADQLNYVVSAAGDLNGDGIADIAIGVPKAAGSFGETYVVFGSTTGFGAIDATGRSVVNLSNLGASQGFLVRGDATNGQFGNAVSAIGDFNGDGIDDLLIGAPTGRAGMLLTGEAHVLFGSSTGFGSAGADGRVVLDATALAARGLTMQTNAAFDLVGRAVAGAGDVNGDGVADIMVSSAIQSGTGPLSADVYVVFGASGIGDTVNLASMGAAGGFVIRAADVGDRAGEAIAGLGDVNGDGLDDILIGAPGGGHNGLNTGEAYVVFGSTTGFGSVNAAGQAVVDLAKLLPSQGFMVRGEAGGSLTGYDVSAAGDFNGDGFQDILIAAPDAGNGAGVAYLLFGSEGFGRVDADGRAVVDLSMLDPTEGFTLRGTGTDKAGFSVSAAGDVNNDGYDDLIIGAPGADIRTGEAYVIFGGVFA